jgi:hypothetical protein
MSTTQTSGMLLRARSYAAKEIEPGPALPAPSSAGAQRPFFAADALCSPPSMPQDGELDILGGGRAAPSAGPVRVSAGRSDTAGAATRRRSCPPVEDGRSPLVSGRAPSSGTHRLTRRRARSRVGSRRISAANTARSAQSRRGAGLVRRSTATSWRRTSSSAAIAVSPRVAWGNQPNIRTAVMYIRRTSMLSIVRDGHRIPAHVMCDSSGAVQVC